MNHFVYLSRTRAGQLTTSVAYWQANRCQPGPVFKSGLSAFLERNLSTVIDFFETLKLPTFWIQMSSINNLWKFAGPFPSMPAVFSPAKMTVAYDDLASESAVPAEDLSRKPSHKQLERSSAAFGPSSPARRQTRSLTSRSPLSARLSVSYPFSSSACPSYRSA